MITVLIPAAGNGQRFKDAGYNEPKPMIPVFGKPMIERVLENLTPTTLGSVKRVIVHRLGDTLPIAAIQIMPKDPTGGAVDTLVKAEKHIEGELIIGNCDQLVAFDVNDFVEFGRGYDGCFVTFKSNKDHHSYVKKKYGIIKQIKEKEVISNEAVTGVYYFKNPSNFFAAAHKVVDDNILVRGEFYVSSVIDRMIEEGYRFSTYEAPSAMLGTPEELQLFEAAVEVGKELI